MKERIFLSALNPDWGVENGVLVSSRANFESLNVCETYGDYGQQVGCNNAGCYSMDNSECSFHGDLLDAVNERFGTSIEGSLSSIDDLVELFEDVIKEDQIRAFAKEWIEENENHVECTGYTYHDGSNFSTIVIAHEHDSSLVTHTEVEETEALEEAVENKSFLKKGFGVTYYEYGDYIIIESYYQGAWYSYMVVKRDQIEL